MVGGEEFEVPVEMWDESYQMGYLCRDPVWR